VTVVMNGDVLLHNTLWETARMDAARTGRGAMDFRPLLADLRPVISGADLAICHLETPLAPAGGPYYSYPVFSVPPAIVPALKWEGYDACTTASNHSLDQGFEGIQRTLADLDRAGIAHAGTAVTRKAAHTPLILDAHGVKVALIEAAYGTNGIPLPAAEPWSVPLIHPPAILRMAAKARAAGADIVLVALHWGTEYMHEPSADQVAIAQRLSRSPDIDFIYGHHVHVVQPYDKVNGTWVVYGLGNTVAEQDPAVEGVYDGNTCRVTFRERADGSFRVAKLEYIPTMITQYDGVHPMRVLNVPQSLHDPKYAALHTQLAATQARVRADVNLEHALAHGVTEGR
jgi:poly-gamma-glutamate synthesis protein (capsule biosynthesis protein)